MNTQLSTTSKIIVGIISVVLLYNATYLLGIVVGFLQGILG
jgi:hypothetical protein